MLTDVQIRAAKPRAKPYKLSDGHGMYLEVHPAGGKYWRLKYRFGGKEKRISFGVYPTVSLKDARAELAVARRQLDWDIDPSAARKAEKAADADTMEAVSREWYGKHVSLWATVTAQKTTLLLKRDVFPWLGTRPVGDLTAPELLSVLRRVEARGHVGVAHRLRGVLGQIFRYAIATGRAERNPAKDLEGALSPVKRKHYAAITDPKGVGALMRAIDGYQGSIVVHSALKLAAYTFVRPGELRGAEWREVDLEALEWLIPAERMKMKADHIVPLSEQSVEILKELYLCLCPGVGTYVFPGQRARHSPPSIIRRVRGEAPMSVFPASSVDEEKDIPPERGGPISENTINCALRTMGYGKGQMTGHGFRAMARTLLDEVLGVRPDIIEHQLAHAVRDPMGRAYNRTTHLAERRRMMQAWADYLDGLKNGADVVPIHKKQALS